jgi:hypothetical protein
MPFRSVIPIVAVAVFVTSDTLVAVTVYTPAADGAVYVTGLPDALLALLNVPQALPEQLTLEALQFTP